MARGGKRVGAGRKRGSQSPRTRAIRAKIRTRAELSAGRTLEQIRRGAFYDVRKLFDAHGRFRPILQLSEEEGAMIGGFEIVKRNITSGDGHVDTVLKVKLVDRAKYVEMAAKHHGLLTEKVEHLGGLTIIHEFGS